MNKTLYAKKQPAFKKFDFKAGKLALSLPGVKISER